MKAKLKVTAVLVLIGMGTLAISQANSAHGQPVFRSVAFHATYTGTLFVGGHGIGQRHGTGTASVLGKSTLSAIDKTVHNPRNDNNAVCLAIVGAGVLRGANGDQVNFLYLLGGCPFGQVPAGYYFVYGGTGRYAGAHGKGRLVEGGTAGAPGVSVPITDAFTGTLVLPSG
jgi:hypothetical protein